MPTQPQYVDTHCHLYSKQFDADRAAVLQRAIDNGVTHFLLPNVDNHSLSRLIDTCRQFPHHCLPMMGLHPCSVTNNYDQDLTQIERYLFSNPYTAEGITWCAVGEIGLDYYWDKTYIAQQKEAFRQQIRWAKQLRLPIVVHARHSMDDNLKIIEEEQDGTLRGVMHCFTGTIAQAEKAVSLGMHLGIGGVLTYKNAGLDSTLAHIDIKYLVLETDAPYLAPVPYRGKRNESAYLIHIAQSLAQIKNLPLDTVAQATTQNASKLFALSFN